MNELNYSKDLIMNFAANFQKTSEGYVAFVEELPGANTQGATLEEARESFKESIELIIETNRQPS